jgi:hypothetical protein
MAVLFSASELNAIKAKLDSVQSVGQAQAVVRVTLDLANQVANEIKQTLFEDSWRTQARKDLTSARAGVERDAKAYNQGEPTAVVGASWPALRASVSNLWFLALMTKGQFPPDETSAAERLAGKISLAGASLSAAIADAPNVIVKSVATVAKTATKVAAAVVKPVAQLAGETAGAALGPIKWLIFSVVGIAVLGGGAFLILKKKGVI